MVSSLVLRGVAGWGGSPPSCEGRFFAASGVYGVGGGAGIDRWGWGLRWGEGVGGEVGVVVRVVGGGVGVGAWRGGCGAGGFVWCCGGCAARRRG